MVWIMENMLIVPWPWQESCKTWWSHSDHVKKHGRHAVIMPWLCPCCHYDHGMVLILFHEMLAHFSRECPGIQINIVNCRPPRYIVNMCLLSNNRTENHQSRPELLSFNFSWSTFTTNCNHVFVHVVRSLLSASMHVLKMEIFYKYKCKSSCLSESVPKTMFNWGRLMSIIFLKTIDNFLDWLFSLSKDYRYVAYILKCERKKAREKIILVS